MASETYNEIYTGLCEVVETALPKPDERNIECIENLRDLKKRYILEFDSLSIEERGSLIQLFDVTSKFYEDQISLTRMSVYRQVERSGIMDRLVQSVEEEIGEFDETKKRVIHYSENGKDRNISKIG